MLSKLIYRCLTIALLALIVQVGTSQNYVSVDEAIEILTQEISALESISPKSDPNSSGTISSSPNLSAKFSVQLMKTVKNDIMVKKAVEPVMDGWYQKATNTEIPERKTKLILALDKVKELLS